jgi:hypothetical protein
MHIAKTVIVILGVLFGCRTIDSGKVNMIDESVKQSIDIVKNLRIYFGHQSVGANVLEGLEELKAGSSSDNLNIVSLDSAGNLPENFFAHSKIGANENPASKCNAFSAILKSDSFDSLDIALFKFCYIDINSETDIHAMFRHYEQTIEKVKSEFPGLQIVHVTVPLRQQSGGIMVKLRSLMGEKSEWETANIKRNEFNDLLKSRYTGEPLFDLAEVESTYPDGARRTFKSDGKIYYSLISDYASDSGHLNKLGRGLAAKELLNVLARIPK